MTTPWMWTTPWTRKCKRIPSQRNRIPSHHDLARSSCGTAYSASADAHAAFASLWDSVAEAELSLSSRAGQPAPRHLAACPHVAVAFGELSDEVLEWLTHNLLWDKLASYGLLSHGAEQPWRRNAEQPETPRPSGGKEKRHGKQETSQQSRNQETATRQARDEPAKQETGNNDTAAIRLAKTTVMAPLGLNRIHRGTASRPFGNAAGGPKLR